MMRFINELEGGEAQFTLKGAIRHIQDTDAQPIGTMSDFICAVAYRAGQLVSLGESPNLDHAYRVAIREAYVLLDGDPKDIEAQVTP